MTNPDRPTYDAHIRRPQVPPVVDPPAIPPRVRRNYTQDAKGNWRGEFTVESWHDPLTETGIETITMEDETVAAAMTETLAVMNRRGALAPGEGDPRD